MSLFSNMRSRPPAACWLTFISGLLAAALHGQTLYDFGNPTGDEQLYIELINRARADPPAEGARLAASTDSVVIAAYLQFGVDLAMMQSEFNAIAPRPPLAPNASLTTAARSHTQWMFDNATQSHDETNPSNTPQDRVIAAGYPYNSMAENAYAYYSNTFRGHAGLQVDWGEDDIGISGGMQARRGHRANNHNSKFREIGVGVVTGRNGDVGPQLVTQDFGYRSAVPSCGTGVAYYDLNDNDFYDVNEGISGLTVNVEGASYYCTTAIGGGWTIPVPSEATTRLVTFSGLGINQSTSLVFPVSNNAKADLKLDYTPPAITSSGDVIVGEPHTLEFTAIPGATGYQWNRWTLNPATSENCESTSDITTATTAGYSVLNTSVKKQGASSFHLMNATGAEQSFELNSLYFGQTSASLTFQSQIRFATTSETFKVQVKEESDTSTWQDVFSQKGTTSIGESGFSLRSANITAMEGKVFRVRFLIDPGDQFHYPQTGNNYGWFIDGISFSNIFKLGNQATELITATSASFTPNSGSTLISISPVISNLDFPPSCQILSDPAARSTLTTSGTHGTITGAGVYHAITNAIVSATPDSGYVFSGWTGDASGTTNPLTLQMDSNKNVGAIFSPEDAFADTFVGTPYDLRVGNKVTFDLNRLLTDGETIKVGGKIPSGLKFNATTGELAGTLSGKAGTYPASVQVLLGKVVQRTIPLTITVLEFPPTLIGNFNFLMEDADSVPIGVCKITITSANQWSATLESAGVSKKRSAKGSFILAEGSPIAPITAGFPAIAATSSVPEVPAVTVNILIDGSTPTITGTYDGGTLRGFRLAKTGEMPPATVAYSWVLDAGEQDGITVPAGFGWMKGKVSNKGIGTFNGLLGDGTAASITLGLSAFGQAVLWSQPYKNKSSYIGGIVTLGNLGQTTPGDPPLTDEVWWKKAEDAATLSYPDGFLGSVTVRTSGWTAPATAIALGSSLGWRDNRTALVTIDGAGLSNQGVQSTTAALPAEFTLDGKFNLNTPAPGATPPVAWKGKVSKTDGAISGALTLPVGFSSDFPSGSAATSGVLVQDESWGNITGCGQIKVPVSSPKGSFRTAAIMLGQ